MVFDPLHCALAKGTVLFPASNDADQKNWSPPDWANSPNEGCLELELPDFESSQAQAGAGNNTLAVKFTSPEDSKRFRLVAESSIIRCTWY